MKQRGSLIEVFEDLSDRFARIGVLHQLFALIDDRAGDGIGECALGKIHADRFAFAGLTESIDGQYGDLNRQPGPRMRRQILIACRACFLEVEARQRQFDLDLVVGLPTLPTDHGLDRLDPIIIGRLIFEPQRGAWCPLWRLNKSGDRRVVWDDLDRPMAERRAALTYRQRLTFGQYRLSAEIVLVDRLKVARRLVDRQMRHAAPAMYLGQQST